MCGYWAAQAALRQLGRQALTVPYKAPKPRRYREDLTPRTDTEEKC